MSVLTGPLPQGWPFLGINFRDMANRQLTPHEREHLFAPLIAEVRRRLNDLAGGDAELRFALNRKLFKDLSYDERGTPMQRRALKALKRAEQDGLCLECRTTLPDSDAVLDRLSAMDGYTSANTRLLCSPCDRRIQAERGFT
jgi:hypothetical protein